MLKAKDFNVTDIISSVSVHSRNWDPKLVGHHLIEELWERQASVLIQCIWLQRIKLRVGDENSSNPITCRHGVVPHLHETIAIDRHR